MTRKRARGMGLIFCLVLVTLFSIILMWLTLRVSQTAAAHTVSSGKIKAGYLAEAGVYYVLSCIKNDLAWNGTMLQNENITFSSDNLSDSVKSTLGGRFQVRVCNFSADGVYPASGLSYYRTVVSEGICGNISSKVLVTVKIMSPLANYLWVSNGNWMNVWSSYSVQGPVLVNGDMNWWHDYRNYDPNNGWYHTAFTHTFNGDIKTTGSINIQNRDAYNTYVKNTPKTLAGEYPGQKITYKDIDSSQGPVTWKYDDDSRWGSFTMNGKAMPKVQLEVPIPSIDDVAKKYEEMPAGASTLDYTVEGDVLVEFWNDKVYISKVGTRKITEIFDKDLYNNNTLRNDMVTQMIRFGVANNTTQAEAYLQQEVEWNDPAFPSKPYPDDPGKSGNHLEVKKVVRGEKLREVTLDGGNWNILRLSTADSRNRVFVRGQIDGKVVMLYDMKNASAADKSRLSTYVLTDHEWPETGKEYEGDYRIVNETNKIGIPGGITYKDRNIMDAPGETNCTNDCACIISRGNMYGYGMHPCGIRYKDEAMYARLQKLYKDYETKYNIGSDVPSGDYLNGTYGIGTTNYVSMYGVYIANRFTCWDYSLGIDFKPPTSTQWISNDVNWNQIGGTPPPYVKDRNKRAFIPLALRDSYQQYEIYPRNYGSTSSLGASLRTMGKAVYDYQLRETKGTMNNEQILGVPGLKQTIVVCCWQKGK